MDADNARLSMLQQAYQGFATGNLNPLYDNLSEDLVWYSHSDPMTPYHGLHRGLKSIESYFNDLSELQIKEVNVRSVIENGDKAIALIDLFCQADTAGQITEERLVHVLRFENSKVTQVDIYTNPAIS